MGLRAIVGLSLCKAQVSGTCVDPNKEDINEQNTEIIILSFPLEAAPPLSAHHMFRDIQLNGA